jgi:hypothetical protein
VNLNALARGATLALRFLSCLRALLCTGTGPAQSNLISNATISLSGGNIHDGWSDDCDQASRVNDASASTSIDRNFDRTRILWLIDMQEWQASHEVNIDCLQMPGQRPHPVSTPSN